MKAIERVMQILKREGISNYAVEKHLGLSNGYLAKMLRSNGDLGEKKVRQLSEYLGVSIEFILNGNESQTVAEPVAGYGSVKTLPLIPLSAMAGYGDNGDAIVLYQDCEQYAVPEFSRTADFLIRVTGNSMAPKYQSGDVVACKKLPLDTFFQWGRVYVIDSEQGALIKRVLECDNKQNIILKSDNPDYGQFELPISKIRAISLVIGGVWLD